MAFQGRRKISDAYLWALPPSSWETSAESSSPPASGPGSSESHFLSSRDVKKNVGWAEPAMVPGYGDSPGDVIKSQEDFLMDFLRIQNITMAESCLLQRETNMGSGGTSKAPGFVK